MKNRLDRRNEKLKIAIFSENPDNDSASLQGLFERYFNKNGLNIQFLTVGSGLSGGKLDIKNAKVLNILSGQVAIKQPKAIIYVRDLDGFVSETSKIRERQNRFEELKRALPNEMLFFLVVQKIEALILADLKNVYNQDYIKNPLFEDKTDTILAKYNYKKRDLGKCFEKMTVENIRKKHKGQYSFDAFMTELENFVAQY